MKITIFGSGYVGLVTGACLADAGHQVICVDTNSERTRMLSQGQIPIYEPGLDVMVRSNLAAGRISFTEDAASAIAFGTLLFIAVGTPPDENGSADLTHVLTVARTIGQHIDSYKVVVNKSTVPVGTADKVQAAVLDEQRKRGVDVRFDVCSNPEFLKEGAAIEDFTRGPRIVVGTDSEEVRTLMRECYAPYNRNHDKLFFMGVRASELTKYAANAMLATKISFMNEIANIAERVGADIEQVRMGIGSDPRIGYHFIYPGCGYGGSCFPKDVQALARTAEEIGYDAELLRAVEQVNGRQKNILLQKLAQAFDGQLAGLTVGIWGLAFKPNTDDIREAPSRTLMEALWERGARVRAYDPVAAHEIARAYGERADLELVGSREAVLQGADVLVICTEWKEFRAVDFAYIASTLRHPVIVDGRNLYNPDEVHAAGLRYYAIGRGDSLEHGA
ncbi:UDP-glucose/GDP-mannose dehydrogenase family protein [Pseudomonas sp. ZM23]|uniref:UDP-glucose 6-dehydrogenase n=1 Tax=Pseudomonas triclosanedens TaxID=2961893 RepID=A0ABY6ZW18_9PSED|nr:UDP-glucose/GDP-mannose dehydrogenase family protein [Pseudomonas triclosanedens]MCP8465099.1 UDP-glucose/GDP-mannose dehydrogenase family protein [Pseudomonas triclosanedens]MCP8470961.1 UDP-glucose/GDP-mannose dehydrogenase family protein [Pseudomonas triclosanedens]MCP8476399.1 UDP-glucose/GDP-mannose dehydrogenase family protein [Pseudomonas triclosanedens]WAI49142.1 UDP-glucose/GDP-mannose dehydrogenase family protein [Pseudomonas triclosanedens]